MGEAGWNFVAQLRPRLPKAMAGLLWFAPDDATFSVHAPFHGAAAEMRQTRAPKPATAHVEKRSWEGVEKRKRRTCAKQNLFWRVPRVVSFVLTEWIDPPFLCQGCEKWKAVILTSQSQRLADVVHFELGFVMDPRDEQTNWALAQVAPLVFHMAMLMAPGMRCTSLKSPPSGLSTRWRTSCTQGLVVKPGHDEHPGSLIRVTDE